jgi:hypothetical protein
MQLTPHAIHGNGALPSAAGAGIGEYLVITSVVVSYQVKPEAMAEHVRLIEGVFAQLHSESPVNIEYKVVRLADGVSFVHISSAETPDGSNPLPELPAFKEFGKDSGDRVATPPAPTAADIIGAYYPAGGLRALDGQSS